MNKLWKWTGIVGGVFLALSFSVLLVYSATKPIVYTEDLEDEELEEEVQIGNLLEFTPTEETEIYLEFLPDTRLENIQISEDMSRNELFVDILDVKSLERVLATLEGNETLLAHAAWQKNEVGIRITLFLRDFYAYTYRWEENKLYLGLEKPRDKYTYIVAVNAAHGGSNTGNEVNGVKEKNVTLAVAKEVRKLLQEETVGVFLVRKDDSNLSAHKRAAYVMNLKPDLVLDLHCNVNGENERQFGTEIYYNEEYYWPDFTNAQFADQMERVLVEHIQGKANGIFPDTERKYPMIHLLEVPAISVELGYLTNKQEGKLLEQQSYYELLAQGLQLGTKEILENMDSKAQ